MTQEEIEIILKKHLENKSTLEEYKYKLECNEALLRYNNREYKEDDKEIIESMQLRRTRYVEREKRKHK